MFNDSFWVLVSFIGFIALLLYFKVPALVARALDERAEGIAKELEEARKIREEAQQLLATYQRKQHAAEEEAQAIVEQAKSEALRLAEHTRTAMAEQVERRTKIAEQKIAQAEAQAVQEVRDAATEVAVAAARRVISESLGEQKANALVDDSISKLADKLH